MSSKSIKKLVKDHELDGYLETSAMENINVEETFKKAVSMGLNLDYHMEPEEEKTTTCGTIFKHIANKIY